MQAFFKKNIWLVFIFLLALFLRLYRLDSIPLGLYEEEVTNAYVGRFILENGRDLHGKFWPLLYFDKFGDYPPVLPLYLTGLATYLFGFTEFSARFSTAFLGALTVFPLSFLARIFFKDRRTSLLAGLFLAVVPWHVVLSRTSAEGIIGFFVYTWALYLILSGRTRGSLALFFASYLLHPGLRVIVPLTLLPLPLFVAGKTQKRTLIFATVAAFILTGIIAVTPWGKGRFEQTSLFHSTEVRSRISANLEALSFDEGKENVTLARTFHNKVVGYAREFVSQYVSYFSPQHLFVQAGGQARYFNVPHQGILFIVTGILLFASLLPVSGIPFFTYILYLTLITPLPAVLTVDFVPHVHRSLFLLLPLLLLSASGFLKLSKLLPGRIPRVIAGGVILFLLLGESIYFWHQYSRHEGSNQSVLRNVGDKEVVRYILAHQAEYDGIIMPPFARLPIYYLYFSGNFDPSLIGQFKSQLQIDRLPGIEFFSDWCPTKLLSRTAVSPKTLIVENGDCSGVDGYKQVHEITRKDSTRAYRLMVKDEAFDN